MLYNIQISYPKEKILKRIRNRDYLRIAKLEDRCIMKNGIIDVVDVLTESKYLMSYWRKLKKRLNKEGNESVINCHGLKMIAKEIKPKINRRIWKRL